MNRRLAPLAGPPCQRPARRITRHVAARELAVAINAFVGPAQPRSLAWLARESGIGETALADYAAGRATPGLPDFLTLCVVLPCEFADIVLMPAGLGGVRRLAMGEGAGSSPPAARAAELVALIGCHLDDGAGDPAAAADQEPLVRSLRAYCERWLARRAAQRKAS